MHDRATRARARQLAETEGIAAAAEVTGVPRATLYRWAERDGWTLHRDNETGAAEADDQKGNPSHSGSAVSFRGNGDHADPLGPRQLGRRFQAEAAAFLDAARAARERQRPRDAQSYVLAAAIATDKARAAGVTDDQDSLEPLTLQQREVQWWAFRAQLAATRDTLAARGTAGVEGLDDIAPRGWDAHLDHPDPEYVARVRYQRRLDALIREGLSVREAVQRCHKEGLG
jgi:hypothetical protein